MSKTKKLSELISEIVKNYLKENGYDGIYNEEYKCDCHIDDLIIPDCPNMFDCKAGYLQNDGKCIGPDLAKRDGK